MNHPLFAAAISLAVLVPATAGAKVVSGTPFADNMVLQRGRAVPVWGVADPGEAVTVSFAGQTKKTKAGADGMWRVEPGVFEAWIAPHSDAGRKMTFELKTALGN